MPCTGNVCKQVSEEWALIFIFKESTFPETAVPLQLMKHCDMACFGQGTY